LVEKVRNNFLHFAHMAQIIAMVKPCYLQHADMACFCLLKEREIRMFDREQFFEKGLFFY